MATKGILSDDKQKRAWEMLREISEHYVKTKKRFYSTLERNELKRAQNLGRNLTFAEFDLISQVHGRIKFGSFTSSKTD